MRFADHDRSVIGKGTDIRRYDATNGGELPLKFPIWDGGSLAAISGDENVVATYSANPYVNPKLLRLSLHSLDTGQLLAATSLPSEVDMIAISHTGRWVATADGDSNDTLLWEIN